MPPKVLPIADTLLLLTQLTPRKTIPIPNPIKMARNATFTSTPPTTSTPRRRPTPLRNTLLAHLAHRKTYISTGEGNPRPPTRMEFEVAEREREKAQQAAEIEAANRRKQEEGKLEKEKGKEAKVKIEQRNRVDDADNEVMKFLCDAGADGDERLREENRQLAKRIQVLEAENHSLISTRCIEHARLTSIATDLKNKLTISRQIIVRAEAEAHVWKGQMMDRDGEVQRLRAMLAELEGRVDTRGS